MEKIFSSVFLCEFSGCWGKGLKPVNLMNRFIISRSAEKRLFYFYEMVSMDKHLWLLRNRVGDLLLFKDEGDHPLVLPVWPSRGFAEMVGKSLAIPCEAFDMSLSAFLDELLVEMERDGRAVSIFPNGHDAIIQTPSEMKTMLQDV